MSYNLVLCTQQVGCLLNRKKVPLLSIKEYKKIAKKMSRNHPFYFETQNFNKNEDIIQYLIEALIYADSSWDGRGTIEGFRKQHVVWAYQKLFAKLNSPNQTLVNCSISRNRPNKPDYVIGRLGELEDTLDVESTEPWEPIYDEQGKMSIERQDEVRAIFTLMNKEGFSKTAIVFIYSYYMEEKTLDEVAAQYGCSKQNVQQTLQRTIKKLKKALTSNGKQYQERPSDRSTGRIEACETLGSR